ncbi:MAG: hypothetical protein OXI83_02730, partial [Gemmatimonadota bacterium]|nr:hypothetical protein [Gemmatimonadota bacterium]
TYAQPPVRHNDRWPPNQNGSPRSTGPLRDLSGNLVANFTLTLTNTVPDPNAPPAVGGAVPVPWVVDGVETDVWANSSYLTVYADDGTSSRQLVSGGQVLRTAAGKPMPVDEYPNPAWSYNPDGVAIPKYRGDFGLVPITKCFLNDDDQGRVEIDCAAPLHFTRYGDVDVVTTHYECAGPSETSVLPPEGWVSVECEDARQAYLRSLGQESPEERETRLEAARLNCETRRSQIQDLNSERESWGRVSIPGGSCSSPSTQAAMERAFADYYKNAIADPQTGHVEYTIRCTIRHYDSAGQFTHRTYPAYDLTRQEANANSDDPGRFCNLKQAASAGFSTYREYLIGQCERRLGQDAAYCRSQFDWADY